MPAEQVFFHMGLSTDARGALQKPGFLKRAQNISLEVEGAQGLRPFFDKVNTTPLNAVHSMKSWRGLVIGGAGDTVFANSGTGDFSVLYTSFADAIWQMKAYKDFLAASNANNFILIDESKNVYPAKVPNPSVAPSGAAGIGGNPNGTYRLYASFYIIWPNGHAYETGLSPLGTDVTVASQKIEWTGIPTSTYSAYYGAAPIIYRNLYRGPGTGGALTEIYYVGTIADNSTTTYSDNFSDATLETSYVCPVYAYEPPIVPKYFEWFYGRLFMLDPTYTDRLYFSEPAGGNTGIANEELLPIATISSSWDDIRVPGFDDLHPQGLVGWGSYLYIPLKQTWIRKQGDDPDTWYYRKTYSNYGIGAPWTMDISSLGVIGLTNPEFSELGVAVFNGQYSKLIASPKLDEIFKHDMNQTHVANSRGRMAGKYYFLLYPSNGSVDGQPDRILALDMRRHPDIRVAEWTDLKGQSIDSDTQANRFYIGGSDGYVRQKVSRGTLNAIVETHDMMGGTPAATNEVKTWKEIKYAIDTAGKPVILQVYIDDVLMKWPDGTTEKAISGASEATQVIRSLPTNWQGYRIRLVIIGEGMEQMVLYSPWKLDFDGKA
jgi:hypothetical protein